MATSTTNFGLTKPAYNEAADVAVINGNMDTVDTVMGVNRNLAKGAQAGLAIVADGDTHAAITAGQYVYVRNNTHSLAEGLYVASANVSANGNITGSNMTAVSSGGLNALNSKITTLIGQYEDTTASTISDLILAKWNKVKGNGTGAYLLSGGWATHDFGFSLVWVQSSTRGVVVFFTSDTLYHGYINNSAVSSVKKATYTNA